MNSVQAIQATATPSCCATAHKAVVASAGWIKDRAVSFSASAGEFFQKVWTAVSKFFIMIAQEIAKFFVSAKNFVMQLPLPAKIAGVVAAVGGIIATVLCIKCCCKKEEQPPVPPNPVAHAVDQTAEAAKKVAEDAAELAARDAAAVNAAAGGTATAATQSATAAVTTQTAPLALTLPEVGAEGEADAARNLVALAAESALATGVVFAGPDVVSA